MAYLSFFITIESGESSAHLLLHADTQTIARWTAAWSVRILDARVSFVTLLIIGSTPAADLVGVCWLWRLGRQQSGIRCFCLRRQNFGMWRTFLFYVSWS